jgi:hypothetical protein
MIKKEIERANRLVRPFDFIANKPGTVDSRRARILRIPTGYV